MENTRFLHSTRRRRDERGWATQGKTDLILDNLIAENKVKPMLVVMPDGNMGIGGLVGFNENVLRAEY